MDKLKETLEKAIKAHLFIANGILYYIDRVDCDEQICYCHFSNGDAAAVSLNMMAFSYTIEFYSKVEL